MKLRKKAAAAARALAIRLDGKGAADRRCTRTCPICGYVGPFRDGGQVFRRPDAQCPHCRSFERHRLMKLFIDQTTLFDNRPRLLHFAPEAWLAPTIRERCSEYVTTDLFRDDVDLKLNIEALEVEDGRFDMVICSHVLEHVDDQKALRELFRITAPGGSAILAVPITEGLRETYEDPAIVDPQERVAFYGQDDHVRLYGRDFRDRVRDVGFELDEFHATVPQAVLHRVLVSEPIFVALKPLA